MGGLKLEFEFKDSGELSHYAVESMVELNVTFKRQLSDFLCNSDNHALVIDFVLIRLDPNVLPELNSLVPRHDKKNLVQTVNAHFQNAVFTTLVVARYPEITGASKCSKPCHTIVVRLQEVAPLGAQTFHVTGEDHWVCRHLLNSIPRELSIVTHKR